MSRRFEFFEHTADIGIRAYGNTLEEAFEEAARGVFEVMTDTSKVNPIQCIEISVHGYDLENLLYNWIEELLYFYDSDLMLFSKFDIKIDPETLTLTGRACGEKFDPHKHEKRTVVKAMTYHMMEIKKIGSEYEVQFVVDI